MELGAKEEAPSLGPQGQWEVGSPTILRILRNAPYRFFPRILRNFNAHLRICGPLARSTTLVYKFLWYFLEFREGLVTMNSFFV